LELGDGFVGDAAFGARKADMRLHFALLEGGLVLEFLWFAFLAIFEPLVDLLANRLRQPCYLASSCHKKTIFLAGLTWINRD
jgi:hypothetical protein